MTIQLLTNTYHGYRVTVEGVEEGRIEAAENQRGDAAVVDLRHEFDDVLGVTHERVIDGGGEETKNCAELLEEKK